MSGKADYLGILSLSERMLTAASRGEWDALIALEKEYTRAVLSTTNPDADVPPEMIEAILENDSKIKTLVKARMEDLQGAITSVSQSIKLNQAYNPG